MDAEETFALAAWISFGGDDAFFSTIRAGDLVLQSFMPQSHSNARPYARLAPRPWPHYFSALSQRSSATLQIRLPMPIRTPQRVKKPLHN